MTDMEQLDSLKPCASPGHLNGIELPREEISVLAHDIWLKKGRPDNTAFQNWLEAEAKLTQFKMRALQLARNQSGEVSDLLQSLLDNTHVVFFVKDSAGRHLLANKAMANLWPEESSLIGKTDYDLFPAETAAQLRIHDLQVLTESVCLEFEETIPQADVNRIYCCIKFPLLGANGLPYAVGGIAVDITEHKRQRMHWEMSCAVANVLGNSLSLDEAGAKLLRVICEKLGWPVGALWIVDRKIKRLRCEEIWHFPYLDISEFIDAKKRMHLARGEGFPGRVWQAVSPLWIANVAEEPTLARFSIFQKVGLHAAIGFPIMDNQEIVGVLEFFSQQIKEPDSDLVTLMSNLGSQISQYVHRRAAERIIYERDHEFQLARRIQQDLLPCHAPVVGGFDIAGVSLPAQETGGDYFDYFPMPNGDLGIAIGDASGHGIAAALLMTEVRAFVRALALTGHNIEEILMQTNRHFANDASDGYFVTFFLACLSSKDRSFLYTSAGHPPGYLFDREGQIKAVLRSTGIPLGLYPEADYPRAQKLLLQPDDLLFLYTDGIVEAHSPGEDLFGSERALQVVQGCISRSAPEIVNHLMTVVQTFIQGNHVDDMTAVCIKATV